MGRRALRKIDPALDLSSFLYEPDDLPKPFKLDEFFSQDLPIEVEVGSGKGLFLATAASQVSSHNFLGIEIARKYARFSAARLARAQLENAKLLCGDAIAFFRDCLAEQSVAAVHVYFPDPWWKKRHRKRRVMHAAFIRDIERVLVQQGKLCFWTDVKEYYDESLELIRETTSLNGPNQVGESDAAHDLDYRTHFERRTRLNEQPVYRSEFTK